MKTLTGDAYPDPAAWARSIWERAATAQVSWLDTDECRTAGSADVVIVDTPAGAGARPVLVEIADAAPLPVRERIRARVRVTGHAVAGTAEPGSPVLVHPVGVSLATADHAEPIRPEAFADAQPDPLSRLEGSLLSHLDAAHPEVLESLTLLIPPRLLHDVVRAWPVALDQHAITVRLESVRGHHDVRLPFAAPAESATKVRHRLSAMLADAHALRGRRRVS